MTLESKILVIDDDPIILSVLEGAFNQGLGRDIRIIKEQTANDGLLSAQLEIPEIIVLDLGLPDLNGLEVCRKIRADKSLNASWIVILSMRNDNRDIESAKQCGADYYFVKPFSPDKLTRLVTKLLSEYRLNNKQKFSSFTNRSFWNS